ncbi:hypothetical protein [Companilactobacillus halodurans]|uniref:Extracellular protein n=1 Tax=Companilactobacillus halodurans TaxID=2584183 RepID=A0A5P0ZPR1_9LACO|nr:hypothetical protein [Companilactobacillus halodurans]MQS76233.1 hypothetical protein [Companilactobacillus halodurans]MQS97373.1 hypothetical protein [Companilactobacillus halodurans]
MKRRIISILFFTIAILLAIRIGEIPTLATEQTDALSEAQAGLSSAPENLGLNSTQFTVGDFSNYNGAKNNALLETSTMHTTGSTYDPLRAIRMTYYKNEQGAIWSNVDGGNYVNINQKQTLSLWMYFGAVKHKTANASFGDGMAFVLQNPANGVGSFAHNGNSIGTGETLGVWGIDTDTSVKDPATIAATAIPNSWALEFDTHANNNETTNDGFDEGIDGQHIAYANPSSPDTYKENSYGFLNLNHYFSMNHANVQNVDLHDGSWHHVTISWNPNTYKITYKFNDKNVDGSKGTNPIEVTTDKIQATEFGGHDALSTGKLQWGFTATNGEAYEPNLIAFESIPSSVEAEVTSDINDETQNKLIQTDTNDKNVSSGDKLAINYHLKYDSGNDKWKNDVATLQLPSDVTYINGNQEIGYITYDDGSDEPIYASELDTSTNTLTHTIGKDLSSSAPTKATITIYGIANDVTANTKVASQRSKFESDNLITNADTPEFTIKKVKPINLSLTQNNISVGNDQDAGILGNVTYTDQSTVDNSQVTVHAKLNGTNLDDFLLSDSTNLNNATSGSLNFKIPSAELTKETNTLEVYVEDSDDNQSTTSTVIITKKGGLALAVDDYSFGSINQVTASSLIPRKGVWNILVKDSRKNGTKDAWNLSAQTSGLYSGSKPFKGNIVFKKSNGIENLLTDQGKIPIANGYKTQDGEQTTNVGRSWNDSEGLMLKTNGVNAVGQYSGEMNWTLSDSV